MNGRRLGRKSALLAMVLAGACGSPERDASRHDLATRGAAAMESHGCGSCHRIPGVAGASGVVGPSLERLADRVYLAGFIPNTPANLARWIESPQQLAPGSAMPDMQVSAADAQAIVAYLGRAR